MGRGRERKAGRTTNIQQLRYVVATAEHGSMTAAAAHLFVAQPALSRAVRQLERELAVTLFARAGRGVALTAEGADVVRRASRVLASIDALQAVSATTATPLRIAASPTLQASVAIPLLAALREHDVRTPTHLVGCATPEEVIGLVTAGAADLGLVDGDLSVDPQVTSVPLGAADVQLCAPASWNLPDPVPLATLDGLPLVVPTMTSPRRAALEAFFAGCGVRPTIAVETDERQAWLATVSAGLAACIWHSVGTGPATDRGIRTHAFDPPLRRPIMAIHLAGATSALLPPVVDVLRRIRAVTQDRESVSLVS